VGYRLAADPRIRGLQRYWRADLAREALFWHVQQYLAKTVKILVLALTAGCCSSVRSAPSILNRRAIS
jgi:hypothetical protein